MILLNKEMPHNCTECEYQKSCHTFLSAWGNAENRYSLGQTERIKDCPMREYEPSTRARPIDKSAMMYDIYMDGVNMSGEYRGCWVRFKDIEKIVDKYIRSEE